MDRNTQDLELIAWALCHGWQAGNDPDGEDPQLWQWERLGDFPDDLEMYIIRGPGDIPPLNERLRKLISDDRARWPDIRPGSWKGVEHLEPDPTGT